MMLNPKNVLLCTVDSLRKDRVTTDHMPYTASLKEEGVWFEDMAATAPATAASFVGIMASRYYSDVSGIGLPESEFTTLAEGLAEEYSTVGYSTNQFTSSYYNYDRGFDQFTGENQGVKFQVRKHLDEDGLVFQALESAYQTYLSLTSDSSADGSRSYFNKPAERVNRWTLDSIWAAEEPTFAWMHHMDPHHPYEPPENYLPTSVSDRGEAQFLSRDLPGEIPADRDADLVRCRELYDAECRYWDGQFKAMHKQLPEDTLVVIIGDHGELLGEHDRLGHPHEMWEELINVPCLFHHPDLPSKTVETQHSLLDLAPTLLDLLGTTPPASMRGKAIDIANPTERDYAFGTIETPEHVGMVRTPREKWVRHESHRSTQENHGELLFLGDGPEDLARGMQAAETEREVVNGLRDRFEQETQSEATASGRTDEDATVRKHLADLGYLEQR